MERLRPDILIVPECKDPAAWQHPMTDAPTSTAFIGVAGEKGLSALAYGDYTLHLADEIYEANLVRIAPLVVEGPVPFKLLAVWADNSTSRRPAIEALDHYRDWLAEGDVVVAGDFNDGPQWDKAGHPLRWSAMVESLAQLGLLRVSTGSSPTFYMNKNADTPYVVDHVFIPARWVVNSVEVGVLAVWTTRSDHMPVTIDVDIPA